MSDVDPTPLPWCCTGLFRWQPFLSFYTALVFLLQVKLVDGSNAPIANETVRISLQGGQEENYTTNEEGMAEFALNTSTLAFENVGIRVSPLDREGNEAPHRAGREALKFLLYMQKQLDYCSLLRV